MTQTARNNLSEIADDLFTTGDNLKVSLSDGTIVEDVTFVNEGGTVEISSAEAVLLSFDPVNGAGQSAIFTLSDASTETVTYDDTAESVTIGSVEYSSGDVFILDGKKVVVGIS